MRVAILEDDPLQSETLETWFKECGDDVHVYAEGKEFMRAVGRESFDLCLIDWMLPDLSGHEVLRWLRTDRSDDVPILFATARDAEEDIVAGLDSGADDYIVKPLRKRELFSRIDAVMRRARPTGQSIVIEIEPYRIDTAHKEISLHGQPIDLTEKEYELSVFLFRNIGRLMSRGHMLESVWGRAASLATRTVDTHISRVRSKLSLRPENGFRLVPTYNYGYRLEQIADSEQIANEHAIGE